MEVFDAIRSRRSIRKYLDKDIPREILTKILDAGRLAPSAGNLQNWKFITITKLPLKKKLAEAALDQYWIESANIIIIICAEPDKAKRFYGLRGERLYTVQNMAVAAQNMLLTAHSLGIGACWVGAFDEELVRNTAGIPEEYRPQVIITLGYPAEDPEPQTKYPIEVLCYWNKWRARIEDIDAYMGLHSSKIEEGVNVLTNAIDKSVKRISERGKELVDKSGRPKKHEEK